MYASGDSEYSRMLSVGLYVDYALQYYYMVLHLLYNALIFIARLSANTETHFYLTYKTLCCLWVFLFFLLFAQSFNNVKEHCSLCI